MTKPQIYCPFRRKMVSLTPEEQVRQTILQWLVQEAHYPQGRIAVEHQIVVGQVTKRCDAVVLDEHLQPVCLIEFKAPTVALSQRVLDQMAVYNRQLHVKHFFLGNGQVFYVCRVEQDSYVFLDNLPTYQQLCKKE